MSNRRTTRTPAQRSAQHRAADAIMPRGALDHDLPRCEQFYPQGTFTRVYAPYVDPVLRIWIWPDMPEWAGLPRSERKEKGR